MKAASRPGPSGDHPVRRPGGCQQRASRPRAAGAGVPRLPLHAREHAPPVSDCGVPGGPGRDEGEFSLHCATEAHGSVSGAATSRTYEFLSPRLG